MGLYAGARPPSANKRASSGTARRNSGGVSGGGGGDDVASDQAGLAAARARVNRSLVMRVEKIAATAQLWSLVPWSGVRRYDRVHVKGITLRLKQVKGILNFSFVALNKKGRGGNAAAAPLATGVGDGDAGAGARSAGGPDGNGRRNPSLGGGLGGLGEGGGGGGLGSLVGAAGAASSSGGGGSMEDLDGIDTDGEYTTDTEDLFDDDEDDSSYELLEESELLAGVAAADRDRGDRGDAYDTAAPELVRQRSRSSSTAGSGSAEEPALRSQSATTFGGALGGAARKTPAPWATGRAGSSSGGGGGAPAPGERARSMSLSVGPKRSALRPSSSSENLGNLGVFKVLGEAFMRRFNAYSDQVRWWCACSCACATGASQPRKHPHIETGRLF